MKPDIKQIETDPRVMLLALLLKTSPREVLEWSPERFAVSSVVVECAQRSVTRG